MANALQQGLIGFAQRSLAPSLTAVGPNRYLREKDFLIMLAIALVAHALVLIVAGLLPREKVTDIPVRALSFKIGGQDRMAAFGLLQPAPPPPAPEKAVSPAAASPALPRAWRASPVVKQRAIQPKIVPVPVKPQKIAAPRVERQPSPEFSPPLSALPALPAEPSPPPLAAETVSPTPSLPPPAPAEPAPVAEAAPAALPSTEILTQVAAPAIAPEPQRFIREAGSAPTGVAGGQGSASTLISATDAEAVRQRYEQQISGWIQQHKFYPAAANGKRGKVIIRVRIDRSGYLRYYGLEQSSGNDLLDAAAIDMIRRANPLPAAPANYPAGNLLEFRIPIELAP